MKKFQNLLSVLFLIALSLAVWYSSLKLTTSGFLSFSDAAKFADVAKNLSLGSGFRMTFSFFGTGSVLEETEPLFLGFGIPPFFPFIIALAFKVFGISDTVVMATSGFFYILSAVSLYFLGKRIFGQLVGILTGLAFIFDPAMLNYGVNGASESLFITELIIAALLFYHNSRVSSGLGFLTLLSLYFTRPAAPIYIAAFILFFILLNLKRKTLVFVIGGITIVSWAAIEFVAAKYSGKTFFYSPLLSLVHNVSNFSPSATPTNYFRGGTPALVGGLKPLISKIFYDLYNFYKLLPQIFSPYLFGLYLLSLLRWEKEGKKNIFRLTVLFMVVITFLTAAATLPIYRYLHPLIPFIYLLSAEILVWLVTKLVNLPRLAFVFIFLFIIGQTLGQIVLDSRYLSKVTNRDKLPITFLLGKMLGEETKPGDLVVTNLDTWGSWYGKRKTVWLPFSPEQLIPPKGESTKIDIIFLTSYLAEDASANLGTEWRTILDNPEDLSDSFIKENFYLVKKFKINPDENYNQDMVTGVILKKKP